MTTTEWTASTAMTHRMCPGCFQIRPARAFMRYYPFGRQLVVETICRVCTTDRRYMARGDKRVTPGHTEEEWLDLLAAHNYQCVACNVTEMDLINMWLEDTSFKWLPFLTRDHWKPIAVGGVDTIENIAPMCERCNSHKGFRTMQQYQAVLDQRRPGPQWWELIVGQIEQKKTEELVGVA